MGELVPVTKPKIPMAFAALVLSELCDRLDDGADPTEALVAVFKDSELDLADATDRRIAFDTWIQGSIETAKKARDAYAERARKLTVAHEAFKTNTLSILEAYPELPYKGQLGRLASQASPPAMKLTISSDLTQEVIEQFKIEPRFVKIITRLVLDSAAVKTALQAGEVFPWASLETGTHLRIRR